MRKHSWKAALNRRLFLTYYRNARKSGQTPKDARTVALNLLKGAK